MNKKKFKYLFADEGGVIVDEGWVGVVKDDKDDLSKCIASVMKDEINYAIEHGGATYGLEIEYTIKPITKDPFR